MIGVPLTIFVFIVNLYPKYRLPRTKVSIIAGGRGNKKKGGKEPDNRRGTEKKKSNHHVHNEHRQREIIRNKRGMVPIPIQEHGPVSEEDDYNGPAVFGGME